jgi:phosphatidylethanolamine/phosphatidyl-N-methylethanolamine N-methyltransferase
MFLSFLKTPLLIGSVAPSSSFLSKKMIHPSILSNDMAIELGAGSGAVTKYLVNSFKEVISYEISKELSDLIVENYNTVDVRNEDACGCSSILSKDRSNSCTVFSSLPFTLMEKSKVARLLGDISSSMKNGEIFVCFFYMPNIFLPWNKWVLREIKSNFTIIDYSLVFLNVPPALVLVCMK